MTDQDGARSAEHRRTEGRPMTDEMRKALEADGEKLRQMTGEDHGPFAEHALESEAVEAAKRIERERYVGSQFVSDARTAIPSLIAEIERLRATLREILEMQMGRGDGVAGDYIEEVRETARAALPEEPA